MKYNIIQINDSVECCLVYIDDLSKDLKNLIRSNLLEIVSGKLAAERAEGDDYKESLKDASKFIYKKETEKFRIGIVCELLFHSILRIKELSTKYTSTCPTIGYSDNYQSFYKGFDGCYYSDNSIWIVEVKSKLKSTNLDNDNKSKVKNASNQIKLEVKDEEINRWEKAKKQVYLQLSEIEQNETKIFELLNKPHRSSYHQMIGTLLICDDENFNEDFIKSYIHELHHDDVDDQKMLLVCIRSFDYEMIIDYIENEMA